MNPKDYIAGMGVIILALVVVRAIISACHKQLCSSCLVRLTSKRKYEDYCDPCGADHAQS